MLGQPGDGWRVSLTTLMNERVSIGGAIPPKGSGPDPRRSSRRGRSCPDDRNGRGDARRGDEAVDRAEVLRLTNIRAIAEPQDGRPGPRGLDRQDAHRPT